MKTLSVIIALTGGKRDFLSQKQPLAVFSSDNIDRG